MAAFLLEQYPNIYCLAESKKNRVTPFIIKEAVTRFVREKFHQKEY